MVKLFPIILVSALFLSGFAAYCQVDTARTSKRVPVRKYSPRDSASLALYQAKKDSIQFVKDSILAYQDSVRMIWIKPPSPGRPNQFADSLIKLYTITNFDFVDWAKKFNKKPSRFDQGMLRPKGEIWVIFMVMAMILSFSLLNRVFSKEIATIGQAFYSNRMGKQDNLFGSWPFLFLYILFGFTTGMFLYLCSRNFQIDYGYTGFHSFVALSAATLILFTCKILVLKVLGFLFDIEWMVKEYISILYLSYFNVALLFLPLVAAFSLTPLRCSIIYVYAGLAVLFFVFCMQLFRIGANILTRHKFSKTYLIIYLCALEVCPVLVLIKALRY